MIFICFSFVLLLKRHGSLNHVSSDRKVLCSNRSLSAIIRATLNSRHPHASICNLMTFMWCLWKARNDTRNERKHGHPLQIHHASQAIIKGLQVKVQATGSIAPLQLATLAMHTSIFRCWAHLNLQEAPSYLSWTLHALKFSQMLLWRLPLSRHLHG